MPNDHESTQSLRGAEQITVNDLIEATTTSVLRAVRERESRPENPHDIGGTTIFIGLIFD